MHNSVLCCISNARPLLAPPFGKKWHVFTKDLRRLTDDLEEAGDKSTVIQQYKDALVVKNKVCCKFLVDSDSIMLKYLEVCAGFRKAEKNGESGQSSHTCSGPRRTG